MGVLQNRRCTNVCRSLGPDPHISRQGFRGAEGMARAL